ncbi:hypothetical protein [Azotosporobacter soli]|uniref:hypothetical protein n=1 Tax=Azotosporobacter soli TaxID=3055040 RepID=UPI0031FF1FF3
MKRVNIFVGEFGSGKTELTINYAMELRKQVEHVAVVDLDLVKPIFRTRENQQLFQAKDILLSAPPSHLAASDLPIMPQSLPKLLAEPNTHLVIDVGGNEASIVLAQYCSAIENAGYQCLMVVNTFRPFTSTVEGILDVMHTIERLSKLSITGFVCNSNLGIETTVTQIEEGLTLLEQVALLAKRPIANVIVPHWLSGTWPSEKYSILELTPYTKYPWLEQEAQG